MCSEAPGGQIGADRQAWPRHWDFWLRRCCRTASPLFSICLDLSLFFFTSPLCVYSLCVCLLSSFSSPSNTFTALRIVFFSLLSTLAGSAQLVLTASNEVCDDRRLLCFLSSVFFFFFLCNRNKGNGNSGIEETEGSGTVVYRARCCLELQIKKISNAAWLKRSRRKSLQVHL